MQISEKIKSVTQTIFLELCLSEGISQLVSQSVSQSVKKFVKYDILKISLLFDGKVYD